MVSLRMVVKPSSCSGRRKCDITSPTGHFCLILTDVPKEVTNLKDISLFLQNLCHANNCCDGLLLRNKLFIQCYRYYIQ
jgi:hypothetical protein